MPDSYSTNLGILLEATGSRANTWGVALNAQALQLLDTAIAGAITENLGTGTAFSMPALTPGAASDSRNFAINFIGAPVAQCTVTLPGSVVSKLYLINNAVTSSQDIVITYAGSSDTVTIPPGAYQLVWCDGENVWAVTAAAAIATALQGLAGGIPATSFARSSLTTDEIDADISIINEMSVPTAWPWVDVADAPVLGLAYANGNAQLCVIAGNRTVPAVAGAVDGAELVFLVIQDATGGRTLTWDSVYWFENGQAPVLATTPGGADLFWMRYSAFLGRWVVAHFYNLNNGSGTTSAITISENCVDWNLAAVLGAVSGPQTINITIEQGVVIEASSPAVAALDLSNVLSGSTVNITNNGYILGHGGAGGRGGAWVGGVSFGFQLKNTVGQPGGAAINGPGSGCNLNIINNGFIWGGGGGGGVGGFSSLTTANNQAATGGGGGGAGGGKGGISFPFGDANNQVVPSDGADGAMLINATAFGAPGASATIGTADCGASGAGGTYGAAGTAGVAAGTSHTVTCAPTAAGAAGNAIKLNGGGVTITPSGGSASPHVLGAVA